MPYVKHEPRRSAVPKIGCRVLQTKSAKLLTVSLTKAMQQKANLFACDLIDVFIDDARARLKMVGNEKGKSRIGKNNCISISLSTHAYPFIGTARPCKTFYATEWVARDGALEFELPAEIIETCGEDGQANAA